MEFEKCFPKTAKYWSDSDIDPNVGFGPANHKLVRTSIENIPTQWEVPWTRILKFYGFFCIPMHPNYWRL